MSAALTVAELADDTGLAFLSGVLSQVILRGTKQGRPWASATLTDETGTVNVLAYPDNFEAIGQVLVDGAEVRLSGHPFRWDTGFYFLAESAVAVAR